MRSLIMGWSRNNWKVGNNRVVRFSQLKLYGLFKYWLWTNIGRCGSLLATSSLVKGNIAGYHNTLTILSCTVLRHGAAACSTAVRVLHDAADCGETASRRIKLHTCNIIISSYLLVLWLVSSAIAVNVMNVWCVSCDEHQQQQRCVSA